MRISKLMVVALFFLLLAACDTEETENGDVPPPEEDQVENGEDDNNVVEDEDTITLSFYDAEDTLIESIEVGINDDFVMPSAPEKEGHVFISWDLSLDELDFSEDKAVYPIYEIMVYDVTVEGPQGIIETKEVEHGESLTLEDPKPIEGYRFIGYENKPDTIEETTVITANFEALEEMTFNFYDVYESLIETISVYADEPIEAPDVPVYDDYTFKGWALDPQGEVIDLEAIDETGEIDLYAIYEGQEVTVYFDFNDGSEPIEKSFPYDSVIDISDYIDLPQREDYAFSHWEDAYQYWYYSELEIWQQEPMTLIAQWEGITDEWLFSFDDGEAFLDEYLGDDLDIVIPPTIGDKPVTVLSEGLFKESDIESVVIPKHVHTIEDEVFRLNYDLESVQFDNPDNIKHIGEGVFDYVTANDLIVPKYLDTIGDEAFMRTNIDSVAFHGNPTRIGERAFNRTTLSGTLTLPDSLEEIGAFAFRDTEIEAIVFNDGLKTIERDAFARLDLVESILIPKSVETIKQGAFRRMDNLESVTYESGSNVRVIEEYMFYENHNLTEVILPDNLEEIQRSAFEDTLSMKSIDLPDSLSNIEQDAFRGMASLESITIPDGITVLSAFILADTPALEEVHLPEGLKVIESSAFLRAKALTTIEIPNSVTEIGTYAFANALALETLELPENLEILSERAFRKTESLIEMTIPKNITTIEYGLFIHSGVRTVHLPDGLEVIETHAFSYTENLDYLVLPDGLERIEQEAFWGTQLNWLFIPESVVEVSWQQFTYANADLKVYYEGSYIPSTWHENWNHRDRDVYLNVSKDALPKTD